MHRSGTSVAGIRRRLISMGHTVSRDTISYWIRMFELGLFGDVCDTSAPTVLSSVTQRDADLIRDCLTRDPSLFSRDIHRVLREDGATCGHSTTKLVIEATGITHSKPRHGQMVRDANKVKRVEFCERLIASNDTLDDVIFSDECSVQLSKKTLGGCPKARTVALGFSGFA